MIHLNMILREVVSNYQCWFKLETHPSSLHKLEMTYREFSRLMLIEAQV